METVVLLGAEEVRRAAVGMNDASHRMREAASSIEQSVAVLGSVLAEFRSEMNSWLLRLEEMERRCKVEGT